MLVGKLSGATAELKVMNGREWYGPQRREEHRKQSKIWPWQERKGPDGKNAILWHPEDS